MSTRYIDIGSSRFSIEGTNEALGLAELFYPSGLSAEAGPEPTAHFRLDRVAEEWSLQKDGRPVVTRSNLAHTWLCLESSIGEAVLSNLCGRIAVHGGAVSTERGAMVFAGRPDQGKTASAFQLLELGETLLSEEITLYNPAAARVEPYPISLSMSSDYARESQLHFPLRHGRLRPLEYTDTLRYLPERIGHGPDDLRMIVLPRYHPAATPEIRVLEPETVLVEFLGYCFRPAVEGEPFLDSVISLLESRPVVRLVYDSVSTCRKLLEELLGMH